MRVDQFGKKERQLRAALEETTQQSGGHFANAAASESAAAYDLGPLVKQFDFPDLDIGFSLPFRGEKLPFPLPAEVEVTTI